MVLSDHRGQKKVSRVPLLFLASITWLLPIAMFPLTSNVVAGEVVPMPTFPPLMVWFPMKSLPPERKATLEDRRASGSEPLLRLDASNEVRDAPEPLKLLAVTVPARLMLPMILDPLN